MIRFKVRINNKHAAQCNPSDYRKARWQEAMLPVLQREKRQLRGVTACSRLPSWQIGITPDPFDSEDLVLATVCMGRSSRLRSESPLKVRSVGHRLVSAPSPQWVLLGTRGPSASL